MWSQPQADSLHRYSCRNPRLYHNNPDRLLTRRRNHTGNGDKFHPRRVRSRFRYSCGRCPCGFRHIVHTHCSQGFRNPGKAQFHRMLHNFRYLNRPDKPCPPCRIPGWRGRRRRRRSWFRWGQSDRCGANGSRRRIYAPGNRGQGPRLQK
jgi:hypothetical protein